MRLLVAAVGRLKPGPLRDLQDLYARRIAWPLTLREVEERRKLPPPDLQVREGELLLAAAPARATIVALDERGRTFDSRSFAERVADWASSRAEGVAFLLGGADGHGEAVRARADVLLSLGAMTWPHLLARIMLLEQLYRAQQILAGHPYHRG
jgi:23S rRNA (pseudouridine1915-N3)-methyltransferase